MTVTASSLLDDLTVVGQHVIERRLDFVEFIVLARSVGWAAATLLDDIAPELGGKVDI